MTKKAKLPKTHKQLEAILATVKAEAEHSGFVRGCEHHSYELSAKLKRAHEHIAQLTDKDKADRRYAIQGLSNMAQAMQEIAKAIADCVEPRRV